MQTLRLIPDVRTLRRMPGLPSLVALGLLLGPGLHPSPAVAQLEQLEGPDRFEIWLEEVEPIMLRHERELFESLTQDYQRDAFIREFWRVRDPYPETGRNELKERYLERLAHAQGNYPSMDDARAPMLLVHGEPNEVLEVRCTTERIPALVWGYSSSDTLRYSFVLVFLRGSNGLGPATLWRPSRPGAIDSLVRAIRGCINAGLFEQVVRGLQAQGSAYEQRLDQALLKPRPRSLEWVEAFRAESPALPADARLFPAEQSISYLGRVQSRTVVRWLLEVPRSSVELGEFAGYRSWEFDLVGEIVGDGSDRLETFRYRFGIAEVDALEAQALPLVFQRNLRPGSYRVLLRLEDLSGGAFYHSDQRIEVPSPEGLGEFEASDGRESELLFEEAVEALQADQASIRIMEPGGLQRGFVRFDTLATGAAIERVRFLLDGEVVVTKTRPPFNVEIDLGDFPRQRRLRVEALDATDQIVASDELDVNSGGQRFSVRLASPTGREAGVSSVLARARLSVPRAETLDRVEFHVDGRRVATLYQEPWSQPLRIPDTSRPTVVRVTAFLVDGSSVEDLVFVNGGGQVAERVEVQLVEVYSSALDRFGRPVEDLTEADFSVLEDGVPQTLTRFERVRDLPFQVGILLDNSASMAGSLDTARRAALRFLQRAVKDEDRAAVITFNRLPHLAVGLTGDSQVLGSGFAGLSPEGQTALFDSIMFSLYYFKGISGQRAILLLTDGRDEVSRFTFRETLEYARRAGVTIFAIGLGIPEGPQRSQLRSFAGETGGDSYFIRDVDELDEIYESIERELRSQYLLAYQSTNTSTEDSFRSITVKAEGAAQVKTMSGYYP